MVDNIKILNDIKEDVLKLSSCKEELSYNKELATSLENLISEIKRYQLTRKDIIQFALFLPVMSMVAFVCLKFTGQYSTLLSVFACGIAGSSVGIPLVVDIVDLKKSREKLLSTGYIDSFSKKNLDIKKNELESKYSKVQSDVNSLEETIIALSDKIQNYLVDNIIKMDEDINNVECQYTNFMNESVDYRNTHLVLNEPEKEEIKKLTKSYGKI